MEQKKIIIIDGNAIVHRAYHALPLLTTKKGEPINAVYGFFLVLFRAIKELKPDYIATAFDMAAPTFRSKIYQQYKAKRPRAPDSLHNQIPVIKKILSTCKISVFDKEGFEADDLIGTIANLSKKAQIYPPIEIIVITGDLDALQIVDKQTKVYHLRSGVKEMILCDEDYIREKLKINPSQILDYKALRGDPSDNIPGVLGIGEKTAANLISEFNNLENLYYHLEHHTSKGEKISLKIAEKLRNFKEQAFFSRDLLKIVINAPINFNLKNCRISKIDKKKIETIFREHEFHTLIKRLPEIFGKMDSGKETKNAPIGEQIPLAL